MSILDDLKEVLSEMKELYLVVSGMFLALNLLIFVGELNANYVPTPENAIYYCLRLLGYLVLSMIEGAVGSFVLKVLKDSIGEILKSIKEWLSELLG